EYVPAENGWLPIEAPNYMLINCFWVSGRFKGKGHGKKLYQECEKDAKGMNGIVAVTARKKQPFMSEKKFFQQQGFELADTAEPYFELWYKPFKKQAPVPQFKACAKSAACDVKTGLAVYYTNACPFTEFYVNEELSRLAKEKGYPLVIKKLETKEQAQNHFVPHTIYSVFKDGQFVTQHILNEKHFDKFICS
ncbi:MAG: GNAT family N-acetyltransferase, partial [Bacteroidota bacterium]